MSATQSYAASFGGVLTDEQGSPVEGVRMALARVQGQEVTRYDSLTGADGAFLMQDVQPGTYHYLVALGPKGPILVGKGFEVAEGEDLRRDVRYARIAMPTQPEAPAIQPTFDDGKARSLLRTVTLRETVGWTWPEQIISETLELEPGVCAPESLRVVEAYPGEAELTCQTSDLEIHPDGSVKAVTVHLRTGLDPWETRHFNIYGGQGEGYQPLGEPAGVKLEVWPFLHGRAYGLSNKRLRITLGAPPEAILLISSAKGAALQMGGIRAEKAASFVSSRILDEGPLFVRVEMAYEVDGSPYTMSVRLDAGEPYALVEERALVPGEALLVLRPATGFAPTHFDNVALPEEPREHVNVEVERRDPAEVLSSTTPVMAERKAWQIAALGELPWYRTSFSLAREGAPAVSVFSRDRDSWRMPWYGRMRLFRVLERIYDPGVDGAESAWQDSGTVEVRMALCAPLRRWAVAVVSEPEQLPEGQGLSMAKAMNECDAITARVSDNQLDVLRRVTAPWEHADADYYPCLSDTQAGGEVNSLEDLDELMVLHRLLFVDERVMPPALLNGWMSPSPFQPAVLGFLENSYVRVGMNHNANSWNMMIRWFDELARWPGMMTEQEELLAYSSMAIYAYKMRDPDLLPGWRIKLEERHPESMFRSYGLRGTPAVWYGSSNQNVERYWGLANAALVLRGHPMCQQWLDHVVDQFDLDLKDYSLQSGVWPEGINYAFFNFDNWLTLATTLKAHGVRNYFKHPYFKNNFDYARLILTPHDPRFGGAPRCVAPIGDTSDVPDWLHVIRKAAVAFYDDDPGFARELMWHWMDAAGETEPVGGIEPMPVTLQSQLIPGYGAVLRSAYGTPDETFFLIKNSVASQHMHREELSFHYYGLGAPLLGDPGGKYGYPFACQHNLIRFHGTSSWCRGEPLDYRGVGDNVRFIGEVIQDNFAPGPPGQGQDGTELLREPSCNRRHVMMVDGRFFLIYDEVQSTEPSELFLQAICEDYSQEGGTVSFKGKHGVDFDVEFFDPAGAQVAQAMLPNGDVWNHPFGRSVVLTGGAYEDYFWLISPWRQGEARPEVRRVSEHGVEITLPGLRIVAFLSPETVLETAGDVEFRGKCGAVIVRDGKAQLLVLDGRYIKFGEQRLDGSTEPVSVEQ